MNEVTVTNRQRRFRIRTTKLRRMVACLLAEKAGGDGAVVAVELVGPRTMARLNEAHLGHQGPTDVITFDHRPRPGRGPLQGEVFICPAVAAAQGSEFGTHWTEEVARYAVHGILHLLGYDDRSPGPRRRMKRREEAWVGWLASRFALRGIANEG